MQCSLQVVGTLSIDHWNASHDEGSDTVLEYEDVAKVSIVPIESPPLNPVEYKSK